MLVPLLEDPLAADDAIAALRRYSLVSPSASGSVSVHRLVQAFTQATDNSRASWGVAAGRRLPNRGSDPRRSPTARDLAGMRRAAAARPAALADHSDGMARIAGYLGLSGSDPRPEIFGGESLPRASRCWAQSTPTP